LPIRDTADCQSALQNRARFAFDYENEEEDEDEQKPYRVSVMVVGRSTGTFSTFCLVPLGQLISTLSTLSALLPRLNKKFELAHFSQAAEFLRRNGIAVRAFVLVKPPFMDEAEGLEWAVKSAVFALSCGATVLSLIPTRPGNGALERLTAAGEFSPPRLATLEKALELALNVRGDGRIFADTWDLEQFSNCSACFEKRRQRIHAMNLSQQIPPAIDCPACGLKTD